MIYETRLRTTLRKIANRQNISDTGIKLFYMGIWFKKKTKDKLMENECQVVNFINSLKRNLQLIKKLVLTFKTVVDQEDIG